MTEKDKNQDIFTLNAQIKFVRDTIFQNKGSTSKIKDLFKNKKELETIKTGITDKIKSLVQEAPLDYLKDAEKLQDSWDELKKYLGGERELSEQLAETASELEKKMQSIYQNKFSSRTPLPFFAKDITADKRITGTVLAYFDHISRQRISQFEAAFPKTVRGLFDTAYRLIHDDFGEKLENEARTQSDLLLKPEYVLFLLLMTTSQSPQEVYPEIFPNLKKQNNILMGLKQVTKHRIETLICATEETTTDDILQDRAWIKKLLESVDCGKEDLQVLVQIFRDFLTNLANPSHLAVEMLLKMNLMEEAIQAAYAIKNEVEKSKSFELIVEKLLAIGDVEKAKSFVNIITAKAEKDKALVSIVDNLLNHQKLSETLEYAQSRQDPKEVEKLLSEVVYFLVSHDMIVLAIEITQRIEDPEKRDYILSSVVKTLVSHQHFFTASKVIMGIADPDFREDANSYLLKGLLDAKHFDEAIHYVEGIEQQREKIRAAKVLLNGMLANHETEKVQEVCSKFELVR